MKKTKLTVRVAPNLLDNLKRYAAENNTTLTQLIEAYLQSIPSSHSLKDAPIVRRLIGTLPPEISTEDYKHHVNEKYGQ
ncbi:hypothetical protein KQH40_01265 [bacterium]|nr:hypothetical protein [bacterium]